MRLLDSNIFRYFDDAGLLSDLLALPDLGITTAVRREVSRKGPTIGQALDDAMADERLALCDVDPNDQKQAILYFKYGFEGFGDGEAASMAVCFVNNYTFISHDLPAAARMRRLGVKVQDWPDLLEELSDRGLVPVSRCRRAKRQIRGMMKGR